ncbi:hypothetical protein [Roseateles flavus]|uniref:Uncharacterized protein n=1 Tax=Roseateles flavus TaxID=3149041 RepID=A0ABV0GLA7_9BURK
MNAQCLLTLAARHLAMNWNPQASRVTFKAWAGPACESTFSVMLGFDAGATTLRCFVHYATDAVFACKSLPVRIDLQEAVAQGEPDAAARLAPAWQQPLLYSAVEQMAVTWNPQSSECAFEVEGVEGTLRKLRAQLAICPSTSNACLMVFDAGSGVCLAQSAKVFLDYQDTADIFNGVRPYPNPQH